MADALLRIPPYGRRTIGDLMGSLMHALGVPGFDNPLGFEPRARVCLLLVDGLGWELLRAHPEHAPFLVANSTDAQPLTAGFPSTTSASLGSFGTALPPGQHGLLGYTFGLPGQSRALNSITWRWYGQPPGPDLRDTVVPEELQPLPTVFERAAAAGVNVSRLGPAAFSDSGLTRAALRGGHFRRIAGLGDLIAEGLAALRAGERSFVWLYHADLDAIGHVYGVATEAWRLQLALVDRVAAALAERLPPDAVLVVTADHGMVDISQSALLDLEQRPDLAAGVRLLAGEPRARYVYAVDGAAADVLAAWRAGLGDRMWVLGRDEAIAAGLFGPTVSGVVRARLGDVVALAKDAMGVVQRSVDPGIARLIGQHGSVTPAEQLVPCVLVQGQRSRPAGGR
jgi:Type I phosphodiesterase / nucleotide pyrophosphatase